MGCPAEAFLRLRARDDFRRETLDGDVDLVELNIGPEVAPRDLLDCGTHNAARAEVFEAHAMEVLRFGQPIK